MSAELDGSLRPVIFRDHRSARWDGVVQRILARGRAERSVSPGEIGVYTATGRTVPLEEEYTVRGGKRTRTVDAVEYARTGTRLV